ncbi:MAG: response regulator, partial [Lachnospiraceae bacterium]|nr:response regulator [Lachnospiraceae bacterium]
MIRAEKLFLLIAFLAAMSCLFYYSAKDRSVVVERTEVTYIEDWTVDLGRGPIIDAGRYYFSESQVDNDYVIRATLPDDIEDNMVLFFRPTWNNKVYINGDLRLDYDINRDSVIPGGAVKSTYIMVPLSSEDAGTEVKMVRHNYARKPELVPETMVGSVGAVYAWMIGEWGLDFFVSGMLMLFALLVMIVGMYMYFLYRQTIDMVYGAFGVLIISIWLISNSYLYPFVFGHYHVDGLINYMMCLLIPLGLLIYVDSIQRGRYRKVMVAMMVGTTINSLFWTVLHFTGLLIYSDALLPIDITLGVIVLISIVVIALDFKNGHAKEYHYTAVGLAVFLTFCVVELITITFFNAKNDNIPMLIGLAGLLIFVVMQQVDDLRNAGIEKQKAIDMSEAKSEFLASMSHEIRTPINSILGMNEMIIRESKDKVITDYAHTVESAGKMLLTLINDVLDFSKIEAGKMEITIAKYSLSDVLADVCAIVSERATEKGLTFEVKISDDIPDGQISDEYRIRQVLINYINNAIKYTDRGNVTLMVSGDYMDNGNFLLDMSVMDTGRGIREADMEGLFSAFSRADMNTNRNIEGTGLGLAIVKSIADSLGGEVGVESKYGKGSVFYIRIPVEVTDYAPVPKNFLEQQRHKEEEIEEIEFTAPEAKILAVDDNKSNLRIVELFLKRMGVQLDLCDSGVKALALCKEKKYDLLLLDHMMPQPDGVETLHMIRKDPESQNQNTPALVLTANAVAGSRERYLAEGFADYLSKPLDARILEKTVRDFLPSEKVVTVSAGEVAPISAP